MLWVRGAGYLARRLKPSRGRTRLKRFLTKHPPNREFVYRDAWGLRRRTSLLDDLEAHGFVGLDCLPHRVWKLIEPGGWVIDAGANVGLAAGPFSKLVGSGGRVWAFEPVPRNVERLKQLREMNQLDWMEVFPVALASESGTAQLRIPAGENNGWASFTASWITGGTIEVVTARLDDLVYERAGDRRVSFIKIDVEGFEAQVLAGAKRTLTEMRPLVLCEFNDIVLRDAGSSANELMAAFAGLGYSAEPGWLPPGGDLTGAVQDVLLTAR